MNVELTSQIEQRIQGLLADGLYTSATEVIDAGVTLLDLKAKVQLGVDDIDAGRATSFKTDEQLQAYCEDVKKRGRERLANGQAAE
jgi:Arc/MetJ-type ribon-helix-helix transcriptional regulator